MIEVTSLETSVKLKKLGITKPSRYFYEWTGATEVEQSTSYGYFEDNVNAYSVTQLKRILPSNVAVNLNVKEIGYKPNDSAAELHGKLLVYLLEHKMIR